MKEPHSELRERVDKLTGRISNGFPVVSSGADDPMIDGLGALSELDDLIDELLRQLDALRETANTARGWLYHAKNGGGMKSANQAFDVLNANGNE